MRKTFRLVLASLLVGTALTVVSLGTPFYQGVRASALKELAVSASPTASSARAIVQVEDALCAKRPDFLKLWNGTATALGVCFQGNGTLANLNIQKVSRLTAGYNAGYIIGDGQRYDFCQWSGRGLNIQAVTQITITGRTCA